jgi:hypothetical protein
MLRSSTSFVPNRPSLNNLISVLVVGAYLALLAVIVWGIFDIEYPLIAGGAWQR